MANPATDTTKIKAPGYQDPEHADAIAAADAVLMKPFRPNASLKTVLRALE